MYEIIVGTLLDPLHNSGFPSGKITARVPEGSPIYSDFLVFFKNLYVEIEFLKEFGEANSTSVHHRSSRGS